MHHITVGTCQQELSLTPAVFSPVALAAHQPVTPACAHYRFALTLLVRPLAECPFHRNAPRASRANREKPLLARLANLVCGRFCGRLTVLCAFPNVQNAHAPRTLTGLMYFRYRARMSTQLVRERLRRLQ